MWIAHLIRTELKKSLFTIGVQLGSRSNLQNLSDRRKSIAIGTIVPVCLKVGRLYL